MYRFWTSIHVKNATCPGKDATPTFPNTLQNPGRQPPTLSRNEFNLVDFTKA
jgi:hypothetical protein